MACIAGLFEIHLQLHSTWRSGPEDRFCWQWEENICCCLSLPLKHSTHGKESKVRMWVYVCARARVCVCEWERARKAKAQTTQNNHHQVVWVCFLLQVIKQLIVETIQYILKHFQKHLLWQSSNLDTCNLGRQHPVASIFSHLVFKNLETAALLVNDWPLWGKECTYSVDSYRCWPQSQWSSISEADINGVDRTFLLKRQVHFFLSALAEIGGAGDRSPKWIFNSVQIAQFALVWLQAAFIGL